MVRYSQRQKPYRQAAGAAAKGFSVVGTADYLPLAGRKMQLEGWWGRREKSP